MERAGAKRTRKTPPGSDCSNQSPPAIAQQEEQNTSARESSTRSAAKWLRLDESILTDKCCVCLQSFEDDIEAGAGVDWIQCACSHWLHKDCIIECITDKDGKDRFCPFCTWEVLLMSGVYIVYLHSAWVASVFVDRVLGAFLTTASNLLRLFGTNCCMALLSLQFQYRSEVEIWTEV